MVATTSPTRAAALARLADFVPRSGRAYAEERNADYGPDRRDNVSVLSPYVRTRAIGETEVLAAVLAAHGASRAQKFVSEVFWRTYWKGWLETHPAAWSRFLDRLSVRRETLERDAALYARYDAAISGATGNAAFDAWARELVAHNYLHNHARMWFASIWIFTLELPWELGAAFFLRHLLDGDPASNTLSWRWVAGLHTRGKTYVAGRANVQRYTEGRLDPGPDLARNVQPLRDDEIPFVPLDLAANEGELRADDFLLLHDDDLGGGTDWLARVRARAALVAPDARLPGGVAEPVRSFIRALAADVAGDVLDGADPAGSARAIGERAHDGRCGRIVIPYSPIGGTRDALARVVRQLASDGWDVVTIVRRYDAAAWPASSRGFFGLRNRIADVLSTLGLAGG